MPASEDSPLRRPSRLIPNPYRSPRTDATATGPEKTKNDADSFARRAASISLYTPPVLLLVNGLISGQIIASGGAANAWRLAVLLGVLQFLVSSTAFVLAAIGLAGGLRRRASQTVYMAVIGLVFNLGLLAYYAQPLWNLLGVSQ
jgi:hypothetical protein